MGHSKCRTPAWPSAHQFKGSAQGPLLPDRKYMTEKVFQKVFQKVFPALDAKLDAKLAKTIDGLVQETGGMLICDGWTSVQNRPIVNGLLATAAGARCLKAVDTLGKSNACATIGPPCLIIILFYCQGDAQWLCAVVLSESPSCMPQHAKPMSQPRSI